MEMPRDDEIRLAMGEMTADQMRTARAAIRWALHRTSPSATAPNDYEAVLADHRRLCRELDAILSFPDEPARQASLCDLIPFAKSIAANHRRYRWLRDTAGSEEHGIDLIFNTSITGMNCSPEYIDRFIDKAMGSSDDTGEKNGV